MLKLIFVRIFNYTKIRGEIVFSNANLVVSQEFPWTPKGKLSLLRLFRVETFRYAAMMSNQCILTSIEKALSFFLIPDRAGSI